MNELGQIAYASIDVLAKIVPWLSLLLAAFALYISARQNQIAIFKNIIEEIGSAEIRRIRGRLKSNEPLSFEEATQICVAYDRVGFYILSHGKIPILGRRMGKLFDDLHGDSIRSIGPALYRVLLTIRVRTNNPTYCGSAQGLLEHYKISAPALPSDDTA